MYTVRAERPPSTTAGKRIDADTILTHDQVPAEEFSVYHTSSEATDSTTVKPLNGPSIAIVTSAPTSSATIKHSSASAGDSTQSLDIKKGQVYFIPAHTNVEYSAGVEVWCAFYDDQEQSQTGPMK